MLRRGFTLTEVLLAVVVVAVLATMAVPTFNRSAERSRWRATQDILRAIQAGENVFSADHGGDFVSLTDAATEEGWSSIFMDNPNRSTALPVKFKVEADNTANPKTFTATATRASSGKTLTIGSTGDPDPSGWAQP